MLLNMNPKKFSGPVGIPRAFLRHYAQQISGFITHIFQLSLNASIIPLNWSKAHVLIYKKKRGDHLSIKNYHPVSVTSTCCKLLEHTVANYIYEFLMQENVLSSYQDGFKRNMLVVTQLVSLFMSSLEFLMCLVELMYYLFTFARHLIRCPTLGCCLNWNV